MKNIHLLPTNKLTVIGRFIDTNNLFLRTDNDIPRGESVEVYITSDEEKFVKYEYITDGIEVIKATPKLVNAQGLVDRRDWKKIILTTDQDLIKDGLQAIDDEFLEWFVKNPSCEEVEVKKTVGRYVDYKGCVHIPISYQIIIPTEEPKQTTNPQDLIGRKVRGFKFEDGTDNVNWVDLKEKVINETGKIEFQCENYVVVKFYDCKWAYPISLIHEYLVDEDINVDTSEKIIDLSNVEGVEMMVSYDRKEWSSVKVVAKTGYVYIDNQGNVWEYAKPVVIPQYTLKELQEIVGHKFEIKEVN